MAVIHHVAHSLRAEGFDASEDGTGRGTPLVPVAYSIMPMNSGRDFKARETDIAQPLMAAGPVGGNQGGDYIAHAFDARQSDVIQYGDRTGPLDTDGHSVAVAIDTYNHAISGDCAGSITTTGGPPLSGPGVLQAMKVRRLTPRECERLQGFPDDFTAIPWRGKPADQCPDGPRYKALGNSMAVPVMAWIGRRIQMVEDIT